MKKSAKLLVVSKRRFSVLKIINFIFTRAFVFGFLVFLQVALLFIFTADIFAFSSILYFASLLLNFGISLYLISANEQPAYKLAWLFLILFLPPAGSLIYLYSRLRHLPSKKSRYQDLLNQKIIAALKEKSVTEKKLQGLPAAIRQQFAFNFRAGCFPVYEHTKTHYFPSGELFFVDLIKELEQAQKFIFLEFFIIRPGKMWDELLETLVRKVKQGVEVRLMYDDMGCLLSLPTNFVSSMKKLGIQAQAFNRFRPYIQTSVNNRDHRKICVVDGITAYLGGVNVADEYLNLKHPFGYWKDGVIKLEGAAVRTMTLMFLHLWNAHRENDLDFTPYLEAKNFVTDGLVQPFGDEPQDREHVSESVYLNLINKARRELYITTPYLVIDHEMMTALSLAAQNGVAVKIMVPSIPDKWYMRFMAQAFYVQLLETGVQVFEYLPGFIHTKSIVADGEIGVIGTINLDYRSLYLHFEAGVLLYKSRALEELHQDLRQTERQCRCLELKEMKTEKFGARFLRSLLRLIAPLI